MKKIAVIILSGFAGGMLAFFLMFKFFTHSSPSENFNSSTQIPVTSVSNTVPMALPDFTMAAENSIHAVVHVKTMYKNQYVSDPFYNFIFGEMNQPQQQQVQSSGSGVIITNDGYIVTNNHVVQKAEYIEVVLNDKRTYTAKVVGTDPTTDIALLKIDETNLPVIPYGNSDDLRIGEWVMAVGNPFNLTSTVTAGIVSAKARNINILSQYSIESFIQTDAAVNPGNSGGALINNQGQLIGVNTAIASQTGSYVGYSFAIPVNIVKKVVTDLIEFGEVKRAYLGLSIKSLDQKLAADKGIDLTNGVYVEEVYSEGAAEKSGIKTGDIIIAMNGFEIKDIPQLHEQLSKYRPGDIIKVKVLRSGTMKELDVELKNRLNQTKLERSETAKVLGITLADVPYEDMQKLRIQHGVQITDIQKGKFSSVGIKPGFIITSINKKPVGNAEDAAYILQNIKGSVFLEGVYTNGMYAYYSFGL
ncbi:MAG: deoxyribonuclease HsdR [Bacteroidetes bacterium HGW-Bacteroidetes-21]|jgi:Do/DeqQ family serine protease|nr:MAG: deoxyribonuclease HsdR [Bacteroidetes bacterium HGW-Bacteroidetes-21]